MKRFALCLPAGLVLFVTSMSMAAEGPAAPKTPQESAERYFAAMASDATPEPGPMMVSRYKQTPEQSAGHARNVAQQLEKKTVRASVLVTGEKLARVISTPTRVKGEKADAVVYIDLEKEGEGWLIADVNMLPASQLKDIVAGFKSMKDPKAVESRAKAARPTPATLPTTAPSKAK